MNELEVTETTPLSLKIIRLVLAKRRQVFKQVNELVTQVREEVRRERTQEQVIQLIETIVLYELPQLSRRELEAMFKVEDLRKTRFAQEMLQEGRRETLSEAIPRLLERGLTVEDIADIFAVEVEQVQQIARQQDN